MNKKLIIATIISSALLTVSFAALAEDNNFTPPTSDSVNADVPAQPPQAALDACSGKAVGDSCNFTNPRGVDTSGQCRTIGAAQQLVCYPNRGEGDNGRGPGRPDGQPPLGRVNAADPACLKAAITAQSQAVLSALDAFYASSKNAFTNRTAALLAAVDSTGQAEMSALQDAEKSFQKSQKEAQDAWQKARLAAANQFQSQRKACGGAVPEGDKQLLQAALDACSGKIESDSCTFTGPKGAEVAGSCKTEGPNQQLACAPAKGEGQGKGLQEGQAALDACSGKAVGDSCTFAGPKGADVTGACRAEGESQRVVCAPTKSEGQAAGQPAPRPGLGARFMNFFRGLFGGNKGQ